MRKEIIQIALAAGTFCTLLCFKAQAYDIEVCAVPQTYSAIEQIRETSEIEFNAYYGTTADVENRALFRRNSCQIVITNEEKLPIALIENGKASADTVSKLVKAPLVLWSLNRYLFKDNIDAVVKKNLKSLSIPKANLTAVGFSANEVLSKKNFPSAYLKKKNRIYYSEHEYQTFSFIKNNNVQVGFLTKPLIIRDGHAVGSYWAIPEEYYSPIYYYIVLTAKDDKTEELYNYIRGRKSLPAFTASGFERL